MLKTIPATQSTTPAHSPIIGSTPVMPPNNANKKASDQKMKTIFAIAALVVFIGLASLAVLISQRQQDGGLVAPNAPESKPQAFIEKPETCSLTFEIPAQCNSVCLTTEDCKKVNPDWVCSTGVYTPTPVVSPTTRPCTDDASCGAGFTCYQPPMEVCLDGQECPQVIPPRYCLPDAPNTDATKYCRLAENVTSVTCELEPTVTPSVTPTPTEGPSPTPTPTPTDGPTPTPTEPASPTPTPVPTEGPTPTMPPGITVNPTTPGEPPTYTVVTTVNCNDACSKNADCSNASHICYNGACRLDANPEDAYCRLKTGETQVIVNVIPTRAPVIRDLPQAGPADWGTYLKVGFGALGVGALLLLFL